MEAGLKLTDSEGFKPNNETDKEDSKRKEDAIGMKEQWNSDQLKNLRKQFSQLKELFDKVDRNRQLKWRTDSKVGNSTDANTTTVPAGSWKDKLQPKLSQKGKPLKYVAPSICNGNSVVGLNTLDLSDLVNKWLKSMIFYVVGEKPNLEAVRGFIWKKWNHVAMPIIYTHEDG